MYFFREESRELQKKKKKKKNQNLKMKSYGIREYAFKCYCLRKPGGRRNMKVVQIYSFLVW